MAKSFDRQAFELLSKNQRTTSGYLYTVPSPQNYPYQWLWDSCFHAIVLRHFDLKWAKQELLSLVSKQFEDGLLPHIIYWVPGQQIKINWGRAGTSTITQPPIVANAVYKLYQQDQDLNFLKTVYPKIKLFYLNLLNKRDTRGNHLIGIINPDESGEDNSPRFDIPLKLPAIQTLEQSMNKRLELVEQNKVCKFDAPKCMRNFFWVKDVPFNVFMANNLEDLALIAKALNYLKDVKFFKSQSKAIKAAMKKYMLEDNLYFSIYDPDYKKIRIKTWAIFAPLYGKILSSEQAKSLIDDHLLNKFEFWLKFPIPSVSKDEPAFDPNGYWRGPTWIAVNWFIFQGLLNYGYLDLAKEIFERSKNLIEKNGFWEYFNPLTGKGLGAPNFTWGTLVVDMAKTLEKIKN